MKHRAGKILSRPGLQAAVNFAISSAWVGATEDKEMAQTAADSNLNWDLEADVIVVGSGAAGLPAAIRAMDGGASVIVVETNYDIGGHAILSGGNVALGG